MKIFKSLILLGSALTLAACGSDNNNPRDPDAEFFALQVLHASPDAPPVNVFVDGVEVLSGVDYKQGSGRIGLEVRDEPYSIRVDGILPNGDVTVVGPADFNFEADTVYTVIAANDVANIEPIIVTQPDTLPPAGSARLLVVHATAGPEAPNFSLPERRFAATSTSPMKACPFRNRG